MRKNVTSSNLVPASGREKRYGNFQCVQNFGLVVSATVRGFLF
jgi:hypothetical protein